MKMYRIQHWVVLGLWLSWTITATAAVYYADSPLGTFDDCRFEGNNVGASGGGAVELRANAAVPVMATFTNCVFIGNYSTGGWSGSHGGAIRVQSPGTFVDCWFEDNWHSLGTRDGNVMYWETGSQTGTIVNCVFTNNVGARYGGVAHYGGGLIVSNSQFLANRASNGGGGIFLTGADSELTIFGSTFTLNTSTAIAGYGGAIRQANGLLTVVDSHFVSNSVSGQDSQGGALYMGGGQLVLDNCDFVGNQTLGTRNTPGGAVRIGAGVAVSPVTTDCRFIGNSSQARRGGAWYSESPSVIRRSVFIDNKALNSSFGYGGAFAHDSPDDEAVVVNSIFWDNTTTEILPADNVTVRYSNVQGGFDGEGNLDTDPLFADGIYLHLLSTTAYYDGGYFSGGEWLRAAVHSPLIDAGDPASSWALEPHPHYGERINMGAYGNTEVASRSWIPLGTLIMIR